MTAAIAVSAPCWTRSGRYSLRRRIGRPKAKSVTAWPSPQARPSSPARRAARSRPAATSVVTAAGGSGAGGGGGGGGGARRHGAQPAHARPRRASSRRRGDPGRWRGEGRGALRLRARSRWMPHRRRLRFGRRVRAWSLLSGDLRDGADGHGDPEADDDESAEGGQQPYRPSVEVDPGEGLLGADRGETDGRHRQGETQAEGHDQNKPVADAMKRNRCEQDDESGRARDDAAGDPHPDEPAHAPPPLGYPP